MADRLGILVNTNRHPEYVRELASAAKRLRKDVHVHFSGDGLQLADHPALAGLERIAAVTRSADSRPGAVKSQSAGTGWDIIGLGQFFKTCDRCVVF
jgi:hypothetical protein